MYAVDTPPPPLPGHRPLLDPAAEYGRWITERPLARIALWGDVRPWLVTRYEDARAVLSAPRFSSENVRQGFPGLQPTPPPRTPGRHLAFGHGLHHCLGQSLARVELQIALPMLFHRLPGPRLTGPAAEEYVFEGRAIHGMRELQVSWLYLNCSRTTAI